MYFFIYDTLTFNILKHTHNDSILSFFFNLKFVNKKQSDYKSDAVPIAKDIRVNVT